MDYPESSAELIASLKYYFADYPQGIPERSVAIASERARQNKATEAPLVTPFVFCVDYDPAMSPELNDFLNQIIEKGLKLTSGTYRIVTSANLSSENTPDATRLLICFGAQNLERLDPAQNFTALRNQIATIGNSQVLITDNLALIKNNPEHKKDFWEVLKRYA